jgi:HSP20 family protein
MSLMRWDPFQELTPLREAMNRLLEESFVGLGRYDLFGRTPPIDIQETETEFVIEASLPGMKPEDLQITAAPDQVTIRATKKSEEKTGEKTAERAKTYTRRERYEGELSRTITLPKYVKIEDITATYEHGVLTLHLPKAEAPKVKQIPVQVKAAAQAH